MSDSFRYNVGGCLQSDAPDYVIRQADLDLLTALQAGEFCYVFSARQMGKSSLLVRIKDQLQTTGARCAYLDMTRLGSDRLTANQWYAGVVMSLLQSLGLWNQVNFRQWWQERDYLPLVPRLNHLVEDLLFQELDQADHSAATLADHFYIFIDEIDCLLSLDFSTDDFFAWMRSCYNQRSHDPRYRRLTFVLFGVTTPSDLISDKQRTPFNIGRAIPLTGFTAAECAPLRPGLEPWVRDPDAVLRAILDWTGGQPFLTQKLCQRVVQVIQANPAAAAGDRPLPSNASSSDSLASDSLASDSLASDSLASDSLASDSLASDSLASDSLTSNYPPPDSLPLKSSSPDTSLPDTSPPIALTDTATWVANLVRSHLIEQWEQHDEPIHLRTIRDHLFWVKHRTARLLGVYQQLRQGQPVLADDSLEQLDLLLSGLVIRQGNHLAIKNPIYAEVFNLAWVDRQLQRLRPYAHLLDRWLASDRQDAAYLLHGQALLDAEAWARTRSLGDVDYQYLAASQDAERQRMQRQLEQQQESERFFRQLADAVPQVVWIVNPDGTLSYLNQRGNILLGHTSETLPQWQRLSVIHPEDQPGSLAAWQQAIITGAPYEIQLRLRDADGHYRWFLNRAIAIRDAQGEIVKWFGTSTDLDEVKQREEAKRLKEVEARLQEQDKRLAEEQRARRFQRWFLGSVSSALLIVSGLGVFAWSQSRESALRAVEALVNAAEAQFISGNRLEALITALQARQQSQQIKGAPPALGDSVDRELRQAVFQVMEHNRLPSVWGRVLTTDMSPDGQQLAIGYQQSTLVFWGRDGQQHQVLAAHDGRVWEVAFHPDGQSVFSMGSDQVIHRWGMDGQIQATFRATPPLIPSPQTPTSEEVGRAIALNPLAIANPQDPRPAFVTAAEDGTLQFWQADGQRRRVIAAHTDKVWAVAFSPDGTTIASASWDGTVKLWSDQGELRQTLVNRESSNPVYNRLLSVAFSPDGQTIVAGDWQGTLRGWRRDGTSVINLREHRSALIKLVYSPDGQSLISGSWDGSIRIWNSQGIVTHTLANAHPSGTLDLVLSADGRTIVSGGEDEMVRLWQLNPSFLTRLRSHSASVWDVAVMPDGQAILSASTDGTVKQWHRDGALIQTWDMNRGQAWAIAAHPRQNRFAAGYDDGSLVLWQGQDNAERAIAPHRVIAAHRATVFDVAYHPNGQELASVSWDGLVKLWHADGRPRQTLDATQPMTSVSDAHLNTVAYRPDGQQLATGREGGILEVWQRGADGQFLSTPQHRWDAQQDAVWKVAYSPDGSLLASAGEDGTVRLWSSEGELLRTLVGHGDRVNGVIFIPAHAGLPADWGTVLASASWDHTVKLWHLDGRLLATLNGHDERVLGIAFYPPTTQQGPLLVSSDLKQTAILWKLDQVLDPGQILKHGCTWVQDFLRTQANYPVQDSGSGRSPLTPPHPPLPAFCPPASDP